ncbi:MULTISPECIES: type III secretion system inner rod subunit SctI [Edwardsiella]|nr:MULTISPECIES: type III secretion system inner rod subunit SctI [Edwardsiella]AJK93301.1 hypothetical protein [Edwardsiella sp. EA181011]KAB0588204.1 EscI/YscI/HrpB family type III secretion system inner rod protein [Edwardsiella anguillarum]RFT03411.1 EscI/YscI/HrpB family type III secretion system inner rod protein [Edwardsiella anguillarum]GAJ68496.1 chaperone of T3SS Rorf8 [Edwardsiella piscicida]
MDPILQTNALSSILPHSAEASTIPSSVQLTNMPAQPVEMTAASQFLSQLLPSTASVASPEQVLIEEIKRRHFNALNAPDLNFDDLAAGKLSPTDMLQLQRSVLNANVNIDVISKLASLFSTSITKLTSMQ